MGRIVTRASLSAGRSPIGDGVRPAPSRRGARPRGGTPGPGRRSCGRAGRHLPGVVGDQPAGDDDAVRADQLDRVVGEEVAGQPGDARRRAARRAAPGPRARRPRRAAAGRAGGWRSAARTGGRWAGGPCGANSVPTCSPASAAAACAVEVTTTGTPACGGDERGLDLGRHAAGADAVAAGRAERDRGQVGRAADGVDQLRRARCAGRRRRRRRRRRAARSASARATCATSAASRSLSPNRISSVATVSFSLTIGSTPSASSRSTVWLGVAVVAAPGEVVGGEQHLADGDPVRGEGVGVGLHQPQLPDAGRGLRGREVAGPAVEPQRRQAGGDRAGGDQHDLPAGGAHRAEDVDQRREPGGVQPAGQRGQRRRPDLDDDAPRGRRSAGRAAVTPCVVRERRPRSSRRLAELVGRPARPSSPPAAPARAPGAARRCGCRCRGRRGRRTPRP